MINRGTIRIIATIVLTVVIFVFVAPLIDLEPSALRAQQFAQMFLAALVSGALLLAGLNDEFRMVSHYSEIPAGAISLQDLICVRLC